MAAKLFHAITESFDPVLCARSKPKSKVEAPPQFAKSAMDDIYEAAQERPSLPAIERTHPCAPLARSRGDTRPLPSSPQEVPGPGTPRSLPSPCPFLVAPVLTLAPLRSRCVVPSFPRARPWPPSRARSNSGAWRSST